MSIIRGPRPERGWTAISNAAIRDARLSWKARGILAYLLSLPEGAATDSRSLAENHITCDGREATRTGLLELREAGYLVRITRRVDRGRFATDSYIYDTPEAAAEAVRRASEESESTGVRFPDAGSPDPGRPDAGPSGAGQPDPKREDLLEKTKPSAGPAEPSPGVALAQALVGALPEDLAGRTATASLVGRCEELAAGGWTPPLIVAWVERESWVGAAGGGLVAAKLKRLGAPPKPTSTPRAECPEHPGNRAGHCSVCVSQAVPPDEVARRRAERRKAAAS